MDNLLKWISIVADIITIFGVIYAAIWSFINKHKNLLATKINRFFASLLKVTMILIFSAALYQLWCIIHLVLMGLFKIQSDSTEFWWNSSYPYTFLLFYLVSIVIYFLAIWLLSTFIWTGSFYRFNELASLLNFDKVINKKYHDSKLKIIEAIYGSENHFIDVTKILNEMIVNDKLKIIASNSLAGDPNPNVPKQLIITYSKGNGEIVKIILNENEVAEINK